jgi:hypothetical protein
VGICRAPTHLQRSADVAGCTAQPPSALSPGDAAGYLDPAPLPLPHLRLQSSSQYGDTNRYHHRNIKRNPLRDNHKYRHRLPNRSNRNHLSLAYPAAHLDTSDLIDPPSDQYGHACAPTGTDCHSHIDQHPDRDRLSFTDPQPDTDAKADHYVYRDSHPDPNPLTDAHKYVHQNSHACPNRHAHPSPAAHPHSWFQL